MDTSFSGSPKKRMESTGHFTGASMTKLRGLTSGSYKRGQSGSKKAIAVQAAAPIAEPVEPDMVLRQRALSAAQQGDYSKAIAIYGQLINRHPYNATHYSNRGLVYFQSGRSDLAIADYNRAIELNPRLDSAYNNRANYYAARGQFLEAILDYDVALDLNPANVRAWINQGITFRELDMHDRALESFDLALCLGRLESHIYAQRGRTYHLRGDWNCAIADYQRALAALPDSTTSAHDPSVRLRVQIENWMDDLLSPLQF